jgi:hypothetical protein
MRKGFYPLSLLVLCILIFLADGCSREVFTISYPLAEGTTWTYSGEYITKVASKKIRMPVYSHCLKIEGTEDHEGQKYKKAVITTEGSPFQNFALGEKEHALHYWNEEARKDEIFFPSQVQKGSVWQVSFMHKKMEFRARGVEEIKVPAGTFKAFRAGIYEENKSQGDIWVSADKGIVAIEYRDGGQGGASRLVRLELNNYTCGK